MREKRVVLRAWCLTALILSGPPMASAALFTLSDQNSSATFDSASSAGMYSWVIDGTDQFYKNAQITGGQSFYYRLGASGPEHPLASLNLAAAGAADTNFDHQADTLYLRYESPGQFRVEVTYALHGDASGTHSSQFTETINVSSLAQSNVDLHLFQYTDLDLGGSADGDTATHTNANAIDQTKASGAWAEVSVTPSGDHWQISPWSDILNSLNDGGPTTLTDVLNSVGPADATFAYQWDRTLTPSGSGSSFQFSENMGVHSAPEPVTIVLLAAGALLSFRSRRQFT